MKYNVTVVMQWLKCEISFQSRIKVLKFYREKILMEANIIEHAIMDATSSHEADLQKGN